MVDLISRQAAIDAFEDTTYTKNEIRRRITELPSAQPERKTGRWEWSEDNASWCCSVCGCVFEEIDWKPEYNYCPNCGVRMNGGDEGGET